MSSFGAAFVKHVDEYLSVEGEAPGIPFTEWGYLFLATPAGLPILEANHRTQRGLGADIALLDPAALKARFPWLKTDDLAAGTPRPHQRGLDRSLQPAAGLPAQGPRAGRGLSDRRGRGPRARRATASRRSPWPRAGGIACGNLVDSAGYHAHEVAAMAGIELPIRPRKRFVFVFDCKEPIERAPLTDRSQRGLFPPRGRQFHRRRLAARGSGSRLLRFRDRLPAVRGGGLADAGRARARLRGDQARPRLGGALRLQHPRPERDPGAPSGDRGISTSPTASAAMGCSNRRRRAAPPPS